MSNQPHIIILGSAVHSPQTPPTTNPPLSAGVIGLTTAYKLLHLPTPPTITLLATDLPTSPASATFTSPAAGAHFRPQSTSPLIQRFDEETYAFWSSHPAPDAAGLSFPSSYYYYESGDDPEVLGGFSALASLRDFRVLGKGELPSGCVAGVTYTTVSLSPVRYMAWLLSECVGLGARVVQGRVGSLEEVFRVAGLESATAVANCTGIAAGKLVGDAAVYAIKGQTVLVRGECEAVRFRKTKGGWQDLVLRRPGEGSILGVLKVDGDW